MLVESLVWRVHVYVLVGAIFKDGLLVGVTMTMVLVSLLIGCMVKFNVGMIGEVML